MADFDYEHAKKQIAHIVAVAETVPEALREKCFELLFNVVFSGTPAPHKAPAVPPSGNRRTRARRLRRLQVSKVRNCPRTCLPLRANTPSPQEELGKLFILDHDPLLPIYKLPNGKTAQAQLSKVMMVLLENGSAQ